MTDLIELEKKYVELGKEIKALKDKPAQTPKKNIGVLCLKQMRYV